jgi:TonB family protein
MMPEIDRAMLAVGGSPAASTIFKATVATALALIVVRLAHRSRAAARHALLAAAFGVLLVLPIACIVSAPVHIAVPIAVEAPPSVGAITPVPLHVPTDSLAVKPSTAESSSLSLPVLLLGGWILGVAIFLLSMASGLWQVRSLRRSGHPWLHGQSVVEGLALEVGIHRRVEVLLHDGLTGPMTCGVAHPAIILPSDAQNWEAEDLNRAMIHELEHVRRGDWAVHCLARAICSAYWFHPLVWIALRQLGLEAERACDDAVLGRSDATAYADQLVRLARRLSAAAKGPAAKSPVLAMANRADLKKRVGAVLDSRQKRGRAGAVAVTLACVGGVSLVLTLSPLRMVAAQQSAAIDDRAKPTARFSAEANLVIEALKVSDPNGKQIEGLTANDFAITEDGVAQTISFFEFQNLNDAGKQGFPSSYYILGYYTLNANRDDAFRKVQITLKQNATATLDYRPGYYAIKVFQRVGQPVKSDQNAPAVDASGLDSTPQLLRKVEPDYPEEARKAKYQGHVVIGLEVNTSGDVTQPKVMHSLGLGLDQKALEAVERWKFKPAMKNGAPVNAFHEKAGPRQVLFFWARVTDEADRRPTGGAIPLSNSSLLEMFLAFPDFAHRRLALLPFALFNWSISAPVPVGVLNL